MPLPLGEVSSFSVTERVVWDIVGICGTLWDVVPYGEIVRRQQDE